MSDSTVAALAHERDLLGDALGELLVELGVVERRGMTGPELLMVAEDAVEQFRDTHTAHPGGKRVIRVIAYEGDPDWVEQQTTFGGGFSRPYVSGERNPVVLPLGTITEVARAEVSS